MLGEDVRARAQKLNGDQTDHSEEGRVDYLRLVERAAWQELQRLGEGVVSGELGAIAPARAAQLARHREAYRRAPETWRVARQALDRCLQGRPTR